MITETLEYYDKVVKPDPRFHIEKTELIRDEDLTAETKSELFIKFYKKNNQLRYCNGAYYKFKDTKMQQEYKNWLNSDEYEKISFNLYYGNGVVD